MIEHEAFGPQHPIVAMISDDLAAVLRAGGRHDEAADTRRGALDI